jgi:proteasome accessory factor C
MISWVFGLGEQAEIISPPQLRAAAAERLRLLRRRLLKPPDATPVERQARAPRPPAGGAAPAGDWHVEVDRFTRLTTLASYLLQHCRDGVASLPIAQVRDALGVDTAELRQDVRLLNLVNFGGDGALLYAEFSGQSLEVTCDLAGPTLAEPARLSPLQADTLLLAIDLVGGQVPSFSASALHSAAAKIRRARQSPPSVIGTEGTPETHDGVLATVNEAIRRRRRLSIDYWSEGSDRVSSRVVEPYLLLRSKGEWYYVCYCRTSAGTRVFRVATTRRIELLDEFEPRDDVELDLYRREGIPPTAQYAPHTARLWYSRAVTRWVEERQAVTPCAGGASTADQAYLDEPWLQHYVLRFAGESVPLWPPEAVARLLATVDRLLQRYEAPA